MSPSYGTVSVLEKNSKIALLEICFRTVELTALVKNVGLVGIRRPTGFLEVVLRNLRQE